MAAREDQFPDTEDIAAEQDDDYENLGEEQGEAPIGDHMAEHYGFNRKEVTIRNQVTTTIWIPVVTTLKQLAASKTVSFPIGDKAARTFQRETIEGGKREFRGDINHAHVTEVRLASIRYDGHVAMGLVGVSTSAGGSPSTTASAKISSANGRPYAMIIRPHSEVDYTLVSKKTDARPKLFENRRVLKQELLSRYAGMTEQDLRAGVEATKDPSISLFDPDVNPKLDRLIGLNKDELAEKFPEFHYDKLDVQVSSGLKKIQIETEVVEYLVNLWKRRAGDKIEQGTHVLADTAVVFENPMSADGSFADAVKMGTLDADAPFTIDIELEVSAIVHGR